jgi:ABC-type polar amino acid transport system ATPase subunit
VEKVDAGACFVLSHVNDGEEQSDGMELMSSKTSLLKCIAELNVYQAGKILLNGK